MMLRAKKKHVAEKKPNSTPFETVAFDATAHGCSSVARSRSGEFDDVFCPTVRMRSVGYRFADAISAVLFMFALSEKTIFDCPPHT